MINKMISKSSIKLDEINKNEALRYLGCKEGQAGEDILNLLKVCEEELLQIIAPKSVWCAFDLKFLKEGVLLLDSTLVLPGKSIRRHLEGCERALLLCVTLSSYVDRLLRIYQLKDMSRALAADALASAAVEQVCDKTQELMEKEFGNWYFTWRYGLGYGDLPLDICHTFLETLHAGKEIGLYANENNILLPRKSAVCVIGLSKNPISTKNRSCLDCNMKDTCLFRKKGERCEL